MKRPGSGAGNATRQDKERGHSLIYSLETPQFHVLNLNSANRFSGFVFDYNSRPIERLNVYLDNNKIDSFKADGSSDDISDHVPHIFSARNCRFSFDLYVRGDASKYMFEAVYDDKSTVPLFEYNVEAVRSSQRWLRRMKTGLADIPVPNSDMVYLTQGIHDTSAYQNSIIPGIYNMKRYLDSSGVELDALQSILDFGCGTGRLIVGWYLDNPRRHLSGCDINRELVAWARDSLPERINFYQSPLTPPLSNASNCFDLICLVSVFTHLSLVSQRLWVEEFKRILRPSGHILITLQGELYTHLFHPGRVREFEKAGFIEIATPDEGSNSFSTYHSVEFVKELFGDFEILGYFPRGRINYREVIFPVAAFQDVYVLKCRS